VLFFSLYPIQLVYQKGKGGRRYQPLIEPDIVEEAD
jgi:hypothetical protein